MKKSLIILISFCFSFISFFRPISILANENQEALIIPDAMLINSDEKGDIERLGPEIVEYANLFEDENIDASESDINFKGAYCIYVDLDIFKELPITREYLINSTKTAARVWAVPVHSNGKTVIVQVSKGLDLDVINQNNLSPQEVEDINENAGKWQVVASTCYDRIIDFEKELSGIYKSNDISEQDLECILFGGVPGIQSVIGVLIDENDVVGLVSLERDIEGEGNTLSKYKVYPVNEFVKSTKTLSSTINEKAPETAKKHDSTKLAYIFVGGIIVLVVGGLIWKRTR